MHIYDCFTFFNEYDLLELRLGLLYDIVDYFVICELDVTQSGEKKQYNFEKVKNRYAKYLDKIIYLKETDAPSLRYDKYINTDNAAMNGDWSIENYQRNCIMHGLNNCKQDDLVIISDLDEIPNPSIFSRLMEERVYFNFFDINDIVLYLKGLAFILTKMPNKNFAKNLIQGTLKPIDVLPYMPIAFEVDIFYYYLNNKSNGVGRYPILTLYKNMSMPQVLRGQALISPYIKNAGWHLSYMGGVKKIKEKLHSIIEGNPQIGNDEKYIEECLSKGVDLFGRKGKEFTYKLIQKNEINIPGIEKFIEKYPYFYKD